MAWTRYMQISLTQEELEICDKFGLEYEGRITRDGCPVVLLDAKLDVWAVTCRSGELLADECGYSHHTEQFRQDLTDLMRRYGASINNDNQYIVIRLTSGARNNRNLIAAVKRLDYKHRQIA
jgi:hypothetical protein